MKVKYTMVLLMVMVMIFTSCDSLWNVASDTNIHFSLDLSDYIPKSNGASLARSSISLGDDEDDSYSIYVELYFATNNELIQRQVLSKNDVENNDASNLQVKFEGVPVSTSVYASVKILDNKASGDPLHFSAISDIERLKKGSNELLVRPNVVFFDGSNLSYTVSGDNNKSVEDKSTVLASAVSMLGGKERVTRGATIYVKDSIDIMQSVTWNFPGLTIKRGDFDGNLISVSDSSQSGILYNITLDGNRDYYSGLPLVNLHTGAKYSILRGVVLQNNKNDSSGGSGGGLFLQGATLTFSGTIRNCEALNGGGLYVHSANIEFGEGASIYNNNATNTTANTNDNGNGVGNDLWLEGPVSQTTTQYIALLNTGGFSIDDTEYLGIGEGTVTIE